MNFCVSIHALLAECDRRARRNRSSRSSFNPRTPCGVRQAFVTDILAFGKFQSTHSLRSATPRRQRPELPEQFQSTHSLRSATTNRVYSLTKLTFQSTHSLRSATFPEGGQEWMSFGFNPRTPCGVRPFICLFSPSIIPVSIHALLAECDRQPVQAESIPEGFNPRTPCGVRHLGLHHGGRGKRFQSTHSLRSATAPDHIHCYSTAQTILCANLPKKAIIT